jgi:peptidoglycan/LPS O-acetylase OafA/YrhL
MSVSLSQLAPSPARSAPFPRMVRFDGLRGGLAIYVMLGHAAPMIPWPVALRPWIEALVSHGFAAVDLFFALSGLVIVQSLARFEGRALAFLGTRAWRILPVYFFVLASASFVLNLRAPFALMPWLAPGDAAHQIWESGLPRPLWAHLLAHLALLQGLIPRHVLPYSAFSLLGPAWSLSAEVQFYLLIAMLSRWSGTGARVLIRLTLFFVLLAVFGWVYRQAAPETWQFSRAFLPNESIYFALGIASVPLLKDGQGIRLFTMTAVIAMLLGAASGNGLRVLTPLAWASCVLLQKRPELPLLRPVAKLLAAPVMLWLGAISYPLYLVNEPVQRVLALAVAALLGPNRLIFGWLWGLLAFAGPIAVAAVLHYFVEQKFMALRRRPRKAAAGINTFSAVRKV